MRQRQGRYGYDDLLAIARGDLTGAGNAKLPFPPMLMFDRISEVRDDGGAYGRGYQRAELDIDPQLWFFQSPSGQGSMPPCLGLDALWQMLGFYLWWAGGEGRGRALGLGDFESNGQILPDAVKVTYQIDITWSAWCPGWVEILSIQPPGREGRIREPFATSVEQLADEATAALLAEVGEDPWVAFGHSLGGSSALSGHRFTVAFGNPVKVC